MFLWVNFVIAAHRNEGIINIISLYVHITKLNMTDDLNPYRINKLSYSEQKQDSVTNGEKCSPPSSAYMISQMCAAG